MTGYADLDAIQTPADEAVALAAWGRQVSDNSTALWGLLAQSWQSWLNSTPTAVTDIGTSPREGYYHHLGTTVTGMSSIRFQGATMTSADWVINVPQVYVAGPLRVIGSWIIADASAGQRHGGVIVASSTSATTTATLWHHSGSVADGRPISIADGDVLMLHVFYQSTVTGGIGASVGGGEGDGFGLTPFGDDFGS